MRALVLVAVLVAAMPPPAAAQGDDAFALQAAVAPAQLLFDAAARVVDLAVSEATRDGTPDAAIKLRRETEDFARDLARDWEVSDQATHREATLAALPVARRLPIVLGDVTDDVARLATATERCARSQLTEEDLAAILASRALVQATATELLSVGRNPPPGVDGARLAGAASSLQTWSQTFEKIRDCTPAAPGRDIAILAFQAQPAVVHPTGSVRLRGVTNQPGDVHVEADVGVDTSVATSGGVFEHTFVVPLDAEYGPVLVRASVGNLSATRVFEVQRAEATLSVSGPVQADPGATSNFSVRLASVVPDRTANATLAIAGDITGTLTLEDGRGKLQVVAPATKRQLRFSVTFAGDQVVSSARQDVTLYVGLAPPSRAGNGTGEGNGTGAGSGAGNASNGTTLLGGTGGLGGPFAGSAAVAPPLTPPSNPWLELVVLAVVLALVARAVHGPLAFARAATGAGASAAASAAPTLAFAALVPFRAGFVSQFGRIARILRARGVVPPGATARRMRPALAELGMDERVVADFERVRYGGAPEPTWTRRLREGFVRAWSRLRAGASR